MDLKIGNILNILLKLLLGVSQLEGNIVLLNKLPRTSASCRLLAKMKPHLLDCRTKPQSLRGWSHLEPVTMVTRALYNHMSTFWTSFCFCLHIENLLLSFKIILRFHRRHNQDDGSIGSLVKRIKVQFCSKKQTVSDTPWPHWPCQWRWQSWRSWPGRWAGVQETWCCLWDWGALKRNRVVTEVSQKSRDI